MISRKVLEEKIRRGDPIPRYLDIALAAVTPLYRTGMLLRAMSSPRKVGARVISYGNITAGGTGKTPAVIERAQQEVSKGNKVAILTRGYGAPSAAAPLCIMQGTDPALRWDTVGDEPALIAAKVPEVVIARCKDRALAAREVIDNHNCTVLILDDGYQYLSLARDENWVVIDASNPFGNGHVLPRGILREPISSLRRATGIVLTHCDQARALPRTLDILRRYCPEIPVRYTQHAPVSLRNLASGETLPPSAIFGEKVAAVCAIAHPESFARTLCELGARVEISRGFPDHAAIPREALQNSCMTIVTEKDAVRIENPPKNLFALTIALQDFPV